MRLCGAILVCLVLAGCLGLGGLADTMNDRQVRSCIYSIGFVGPFVVAQTITATGGVTLEECYRMR
jgi:hypothetical protein